MQAGPSDNFPGESFLGNLTRVDFDALTAFARNVRFLRGEVLLAAGAEPQRMVFLLEGCVKLSHYTPEGLEVLLEMRGAGEPVVECAVLHNQASELTATAVSPGRALSMGLSGFRRLLDTHPGLQRALLLSLARYKQAADRARVRLATQDLTTRLAELLLDLAERFGERTAGGVRIRVGLSQEDLGAWVGATREATARSLRGMRDEGIIALRRKQVVVSDLEGLHRLLKVGAAS
jgi:CRP/FNR family transcriptional regulator, cyclic AMP receptor protein